MIGRLIVATVGTALIAALITGVMTAVSPESLRFTGALLCTGDDETMEIRTLDNADGSFSIAPECINSDNVVMSQPADVSVLGVAWLAVMVPTFLILYLLLIVSARQRKNVTTFQTGGGIQVTVQRGTLSASERNRMRYDEVTYTQEDQIRFLEDARREGRISAEDYERIRNKIILGVLSKPMEMVTQLTTLSDKLKQLKDAYDQGLITAAEYEAERQETLDEF